MKTLLPGSVLMSAAVLLIGVPVRAWAGAAPPVGFVRLALAPGEQRLAAMPFHAADAAVDKVLAGQLTGSVSEELADRIGKWDSAKNVYTFAAKAADAGDADKDGKWFASFASWTPSDLQLRVGDGFVICNRQDYPQTVLLCGEVPLEDAQAITLAPPLSLFGYAYAAAVRTGHAGQPRGILDASGSGVTPTELLLGRGYWSISSEAEPLLWTVPRPYGLPSDEPDPRLKVKIEPEPGDGAVRLRIALAASEDVIVQILRQHLPEDGRLDTAGGWETAQSALPVKAGAEAVWCDPLPADPDAEESFCARVYLVRTCPVSTQEQGSTATAGGNVSTAGAGTEVSSPPSGEDTATGGPTASGGAGNGPRPAGRTIYVDCMIGDDSKSGLRDAVTANDAPKRTINAALRAAQPGEVISVNAGVYVEEVNFSGVTMVTRGEVVLR